MTTYYEVPLPTNHLKKKLTLYIIFIYLYFYVNIHL